jgi:hypothetical protein
MNVQTIAGVLFLLFQEGQCSVNRQKDAIGVRERHIISEDEFPIVDTVDG